MFSVNLVIFFTQLVHSTSRANKVSGLGYLFVNGSQTPYCDDLSPNELCPRNLINYKIVGFNKTTDEVAKLQVVKVALETLHLFQVSQACRNSVQAYSCSNNFAICTPDTKYGVNLRYDYFRTKVACESIKSNCPVIVADAITFNCSLIQKDVSGYTYCTKLPEVQGDVCPKSNYEYPAALGYFYKKSGKGFPRKFVSCEQEFVDVYCQMMRGSICSTDMTLRMNAVSQQDCTLTITKCIIKVAKVQNYFMEVCKLFPNANTAQRVPLPSVVSNDVVNTKWKSFVYAVFS